jgi:hypothetical protein
MQAVALNEDNLDDNGDVGEAKVQMLPVAKSGKGYGKIAGFHPSEARTMDTAVSRNPSFLSARIDILQVRHHLYHST